MPLIQILLRMIPVSGLAVFLVLADLAKII